MLTKTDKYILSDADSLKPIRRAQFMRQLPALAVLGVSFMINFFFPGRDLYIPALILAMLAVGAYLLIGASFRYRVRLPLPDANSIVSPIQGRVAYVRGNEDIHILNIRRIFLDTVEIRSPHDSCVIDDGTLRVNTAMGTFSFRFNSNYIRWIPNADMSQGNVIGYMYFSGSCTITFPKAMQVLPSAKQAIECPDVLVTLSETENSTDAG